jgi:pimeloyl-ACP methyl ester carboxylesterase
MANLAFDVMPAKNGASSLLYLCGFRSDFQATKAAALAAWCQETGRGLVRFDYSGHGQSDGDFLQGTIGRWIEEAAEMLVQHTQGPQILVGSSMGGWIALHLAKRLPARVRAVVGIAAAPDFTEDLLLPRLAPAAQTEMWEHGVTYLPNCDPAFAPWPITRALIEDGRAHLLLKQQHALPIPIRLLHGLEDADVPWQTAMALQAAITSPDLQIVLVKGGDHRLSRPQDVRLLLQTLEGIDS